VLAPTDVDVVKIDDPLADLCKQARIVLEDIINGIVSENEAEWQMKRFITRMEELNKEHGNRLLGKYEEIYYSLLRQIDERCRAVCTYQKFAFLLKESLNKMNRNVI